MNLTSSPKPALRRLARSLESIPGSTATTFEWRQWLADDYDLARPLLVPAGGLGQSVPGAFGATLRVVEHGPDDYVTVCPLTEKVDSIARDDLVIYQIEWGSVTRSLCGALSLEEMPVDKRQFGAWMVGERRPYAGQSFAVWLVIAPDADSFESHVDQLLARSHDPYILVTTSSRVVPLRKRDQLGTVLLLTLEEHFCLERDGRLGASSACLQSLRSFEQRHMSVTDRNEGMVFFATPANATWSNLLIRFKDPERVFVQIGDQAAVLNFSQMGMADGRSATPDKQWQLLQALAECCGDFGWNSAGAARAQQKRKEKLAKALKRFFHIPGEPIEMEGSGWRTVFTLEPAE